MRCHKSSPVSIVDLMKYLFAFINAAFCVRCIRFLNADKTAHDAFLLCFEWKRKMIYCPISILRAAQQKYFERIQIGFNVSTD